jgi:hypothetical protein
MDADPCPCGTRRNVPGYRSKTVLLKYAPDRVTVLRHLVGQFGPLWIGTDIPSFEAHVKLLEEFTTDGDATVSTYATEERSRETTRGNG